MDHKHKWNFTCLNYFFRKIATPQEKNNFFSFTLPRMQKLALSLPELFEECEIPLLVAGKQQTLLLSQKQIACLLCNAFFCTFPKRQTFSQEFANYPSINFNTLFTGKCAGSRAGKLRCLIHYFERIVSTGRAPFLDVCVNEW
jgi:poly(ADP-ribose) glycohydrolase